MDNKKITIGTFGVDLDTTEVTKKLSELQNKLKGMMGAQTTLGDSPKDMQMKQAFQRSEGIYRDQMKKKYEEQGKIVNDLLKKEKELGKELDGKVKSQKKLNELQQEYIQLTNQLQQARSNQQTAAQNICPPGHKYDPATKQCVPIEGGPGGGGPGGGGPGGIRGFLNSAQGTATGVAAMSKAIVEGMDFFNRRRPTYSAQRTISLAESMFEPSRRAMKGQGFEDLMFADERATARKDSFNMAQDQRGINKGMSGLQGMAGLGMVAAGIMTGGIAPLLLGLAAGGATLFGGKGMGFEGLKGMATGDWTEINKMTGQQGMDYYKTQIEKNKADNPIRTMFKDFLTENRGSIISGIRQTGMSEQDFMNNYTLGKGTFGEQDFSFNQRIQMSQQMMQSGGSIGSAYGQNMVTALQAQRGLGLSNAGQTMGRLSSYLNANESDEAFIRILGKGVKIGTSELRDVQQDYFEQVSVIAQKVGTNDDLVSSMMSAALQGNMTRRGVEFASEATQDAMQAMNQNSGLTGALKARAIAKSEATKNLSALDKKLLLDTELADIEVGNDKTKYFYEKSGFKGTEEEFVNEIKGMFSGSTVGGMMDVSSRINEINEILKTGKEKDKKTGEMVDISDERRKRLEIERGMKFSFRQSRRGTSDQQKAFASAVLDFQQMEGAEGEFKDEMGELQQLKYNEKFLDKKGKKRLEELKGKVASFKDTPEGIMEQMTAMTNQMQQQELQATTVGKDGKGKNIMQVMEEMSKNIASSFDKTVAERVELTMFNKALADGTEKLFNELIQKYSDYEPVSVPTYDRHGMRQTGTKTFWRKKTKSNVKSGEK